MSITIEVTGLDEVIQGLKEFPRLTRQLMDKAMEASLLAIWERVKPYPPPPETSTYRRTMTLGRSLGSTLQGGKAGMEPDIYEVRQGAGYLEGRFGTQLDYAQYVIGENQAWMHKDRWWKLSEVAESAKATIDQIWQTMGEELAAWMRSR